MKLSSLNLLTVLIASTLLISCKKKKEETGCEEPVKTECIEDISASSSVEGYNILAKLPGIWNGPVYSPTPLGSFNEWIVDFRPNSASQISAKNELDSLNDIFMSFFIVKHDCEYKMAFRNGGGFAGQVRTSYMLIDSLSELPNHSFYRFVDPVSGGDRVYTDVTFKDDSLIMHTYTNQYNTLSTPETHMIWRADLRDSNSGQDAINHFNFPQKTLVKDFSTSFESLSEAVFYSNNPLDPFPESDQPYLGEANVSVTISNPLTIDPAKKALIIVTTQPLFSGMVFNPANLDTRSRYVFVGANSPTGYNFNYMHPGDYYVNVIYDENGDYSFSSGDYMNSSFDVPFTLLPEGNANVNVNVNFQIP